MEKHTEKIRIWGVVQGVGFRPFVAKTADRLDMKGEVRNSGGLVEIVVTDEPERIADFVAALERERPPRSEFVKIERKRLKNSIEFTDFKIMSSKDEPADIPMIPPDIAICPDCLSEMRDQNNPRYRHPFISCMSCGPRYTIIDRLPYDRGNTSMVDFPFCPSCKKEYEDRCDRRMHAQTVSCHNCGPVVKYVSYESHAAKRPNDGFNNGPSASMDASDEGNTQGERNSGKCGIVSSTIDSGIAADELRGLGSRERAEEAIKRAAVLLRGDALLGFKSMGGYNLVCDPFSESAVEKLRMIKGREIKPFAVLFESTEDIEKYSFVCEEERKLLESPARPIVLLRRRESNMHDGGAVRLGAFLPSMGLQYMLLEAYGGPLIFTSMNTTDLPIIYKDAEALEFMQKSDGLILAVLYNDREIRRSVDDSVLKLVRPGGEGSERPPKVQMIRRSKGYAPLPIYLGAEGQPPRQGEGDCEAAPGLASSWALGGLLKNSLTLVKDGFAYVSEPFGDLSSRENLERYTEAAAGLKKLLNIEPERLACDMHPAYPTTRIAEEYRNRNNAQAGEHHACKCIATEEGQDTQNGGAEIKDLALIKVQHHYAHIASVMAEHGLSGPLIGIAMDGTGYGTDGTVWGGEVLLCSGAEFERFSHLPAIRMIGGDESMREAWKSAACYLHAYGRGSAGSSAPFVACSSDVQEGTEHSRKAAPEERRGEGDTTKDYLDECLANIIRYAEENNTLREHNSDIVLVHKALSAGINSIESSSAGRIFDAVSAMLGLCAYNSYEGQAAEALEAAAVRAFTASGAQYLSIGDISVKHEKVSEAENLALEFHKSLAKWILNGCEKAREKYRDHKNIEIEKVALSGGVFQNSLLLEMSMELLEKAGFRVYINEKLPPNDGGIALGQAYVASLVRKEK